MKRILLPAASVLALSWAAAFAQAPIVRSQPDAQQQDATNPAPRAHRGHSPEKEAAKLSKELSLTSEQTARLTPIFAAREQKVAALQANTALAPEDMKKQMHAIHKDTEQQIAGILTPDQLQQMKSMHHAREQHQHDDPTAPPAA